FLGQPSIVFKVPFRYDGTGATFGTATYAGYGAWDGQDGDLRPPDGSITTDKDGSGLGRLVGLDGQAQGNRFAVVVGACGGDGGMPSCDPPGAPEALSANVTPAGTGLDLTFRVPALGGASYYEVRYQLGSDPITDDNFEQQLSGPMKGGGDAGTTIS